MRLFVIAVLLSFTVEAQVINPCSAGKNCSANSIVIGSGTNRFLVGTTTGPFGTTLPGFKYDPGSTSLSVCNANNASCISLNIGSGTVTVPNLSTSGALTAAYYSSGTYANPATLPTAAALRGWTADLATGRMWKSNTAEWTEVGDGHKEARWRTYVIESDRSTGASQPFWNPGPRVGGAAPAFTSAGTITSATGVYSEAFTNIASAAVIGSQAHHSSSAFFAPGAYVSARAGVTGTTSTRVFIGMSGTLPITSGSATPAVHAAVFRFDTSAGDTTWKACTGAGVALTCVDTTVTVTGASDLEALLEIDCREASALGLPTACTFWVNGIPRARVTTNLPAASVGHTASAEALAASQRIVKVGARVIEAK